jgi:hypothetical protein
MDATRAGFSNDLKSGIEPTLARRKVFGQRRFGFQIKITARRQQGRKQRADPLRPTGAKRGVQKNQIPVVRALAG